MAAALAALWAAGLIEPGDVPANMLGDPMPLTVGGQQVTIRARWGSTATVPPSDPAMVYVWVRTSRVQPGNVPFNPTSLGLQPCTDDEVAGALGGYF